MTGDASRDQLKPPIRPAARPGLQAQIGQLRRGPSQAVPWTSTFQPVRWNESIPSTSKLATIPLRSPGGGV
jgi:hypothetical protein